MTLCEVLFPWLSSPRQTKWNTLTGRWAPHSWTRWNEKGNLGAFRMMMTAHPPHNHLSRTLEGRQKQHSGESMLQFKMCALPLMSSRALIRRHHPQIREWVSLVQDCKAPHHGFWAWKGCCSYGIGFDRDWLLMTEHGLVCLNLQSQAHRWHPALLPPTSPADHHKLLAVR